MARGFFFGAIWGTLVVAVLIALVSLAQPASQDAPPEATPATGSAEVPPGTEFTRPADDLPAELPQPAARVVEQGEVPRSTAPRPDDLVLPPEATRPLHAPEIAGPEIEAPAQPLSAAPEDSGPVTRGTTSDTPVRVMPSSQMQEPLAERAAQIVADPDEGLHPAEDAAPVAVEDSTDVAAADRPVEEAASLAMEAVVPEEAAPFVEQNEQSGAFPGTDLDALARAPQFPRSEEGLPEVPEEVRVDPPATTLGTAQDRRVAEIAAEAAPGSARPDAAGPVVAEPAPESLVPDALDGTTAGVDGPTESASAESPAPDVTILMENGSSAADMEEEAAPAAPVAVDRPAVSALPGRPAARLMQPLAENFTPEDDSGAEDSAADEAELEAAELADLPPIRRFAAPHSADADRPKMAIVLIDTDEGPLGPDALRGFPYPVSVAIDPSRPDATEAMERYRAQGLEVLALASLPAGAAPQDVEIAAESWFHALPETVALLEAEPAALQHSSAQSLQLAEKLASEGRGLILHSAGLDTGRKLAEREDVPVATLFQDLDAEGQSSVVIGRFLDYAAFRAGQEGGVVVLARMRPDTIAALIPWALAERASRVSLVPVSAVLLDKAGG